MTQSECTSLPIGPRSTRSASSTLTFKTGADRGEAPRQSSELWRPSCAELPWNQTSHPALFFLLASLSDCGLWSPPSYSPHNLHRPLSLCLFTGKTKCTQASWNSKFISKRTDSFSHARQLRKISCLWFWGGASWSLWKLPCRGHQGRLTRNLKQMCLVRICSICVKHPHGMQKHALQMSCVCSRVKPVCTVHICWEPVTTETVRGFSNLTRWFSKCVGFAYSWKILNIRHTLTLLSQAVLQSKDWLKILPTGAFQGGHVRLQTWSRRGAAAFQWQSLSAIFLIFPKRFWAGAVHRFTPVCFIFLWSCYDDDAFSGLLIRLVGALTCSADETCSLKQGLYKWDYSSNQINNIKHWTFWSYAHIRRGI